MYRVLINVANNNYRAVHSGTGEFFEHDDWRVFTAELKARIEKEAELTLHGDTVEMPAINTEFLQNRRG